MGFLRIYCGSCGDTWEVYRRDVYGERARQCPHCTAKIDKKTWRENVLQAFEEVETATARLMMDNANHQPLFTVDYMDDSIYRNARGTRPQLE